MFVINRHGEQEPMLFDRITERLNLLIEIKPRLSHVDPVIVTQKIASYLAPGMTTADIDVLAAETCSYIMDHPEYETLAARIIISNLQKETYSTFSSAVDFLYHYKYDNGNKANFISDETYNIVTKYATELDRTIDKTRDYLFDYFGFKTLSKSYLYSVKMKKYNKLHTQIIETPQYLYMRVAIGIHGDDLEKIIDTYNCLSLHYYTHASPTLFNAGSNYAQMSSCFLLDMNDDSIDGIYKTLGDCAKISKFAGGIGLAIHQIRANGSIIRSTNGYSNGIVPMLKLYNNTSNFVNQGGKRSGSFAVYIKPWHADIFSFLDLKLNQGKEEFRCRDLFYGLWVPDLFMKRVQNDESWSLFCPDQVPGLNDCYGEDFENLYASYEKRGIARKIIKARDLWEVIIDRQIETGGPYMLYSDSCNRKSNQKHLGVIKSSNLCTEIILYTDKNETAVCNLASLCLAKFIKNGKLDHQLLSDMTKKLVFNINKVIDRNYYPTPETKFSNLKNRPIGIGVQGLANLFAKLNIAYDSEDAKNLNILIFETIYYSALDESCRLAELYGYHESYPGSPLSKGIFHFEMCENYDPEYFKMRSIYDWEKLRARILKFGVRNSQLIALMPTATTSHILGFEEAIFPYSSAIALRKVLAGDFICVIKDLVEDLQKYNLWNEEIRKAIIGNKGSIQSIETIPITVREKYKTVWDVKQKVIIDMAADRQLFVDQSQSMNIHLKNPTYEDLSAIHMYAWKSGLKTGMYYLRRFAAISAADIVNSVVSNNNNIITKTTEDKPQVCRKENGCISCGS